ncbi:hypothetical protein EVAR_99243_1 [Eumeta japonica]|uniref:Uncharacterized protein n=1 Tax=Eumeta variegata TaxID=151549 RepID=A0A4C2A225_EUMVA|nr:hypothetical protein EVAR_99243_1 [Eumeta japonica]
MGLIRRVIEFSSPIRFQFSAVRLLKKRDVISKTSETQRHVKHESVNDPRLLAHRKYFRKPIDEEARTTRRSKAKLYQDTSKQRRCPAFRYPLIACR